MDGRASHADRPNFSPGHDNVRVVGFTGDDEALVEALQQGHPGAPAALFDRYGGHVQRVLANVMGVDPELADLLHEVFAQAMRSIRSIRDGQQLKAWITRIAVFTARGCIRARRRQRWLRFRPDEELPEITAPAVSPELREAVQATYQVLERMSADLRLAFTLRYVHGMELKEVATACGVSLATIKRRLDKAEARFFALAVARPSLASWIGRDE
jgi:RNA polymerase sigma-70 factor, ECF subfamily